MRGFGHERTALAVLVLGGSCGAIAQLVFGDGPLALAVGWHLGMRAPGREIGLPIFSGAIVGTAVVVAALLRRRAPRPSDLIRALAAVAVIDVSVDLMRMATEPVPAQIRGLYAAYVRIGMHGYLVALGVAAGWVAPRWRAAPALAGASSTLVALGLVALSAAAPTAGGALALGLIGAAGGIGRWRPLAWIARSVRSEAAIVAGIALAALVMRVALAWSFWSQLGMEYPLASDDGDKFDLYAWATAQGDDRYRTSYWNSLYVEMIAGVYRIVGHSPFAVGVTQSVVGTAGVVATYLFARAAGGRAVAALAALAVAGDTLLISSSAGLGHEAVTVPLVMVALAALAHIPGVSVRRGSALIALAIAALAIAMASRDALRALPIALAVCVLLVRAELWGSRRRLWIAALLVLSVLLVLPYDAHRGRIELYSSGTGSAIDTEGRGLLAKEWEWGHRDLVALGVGPQAGLRESLEVVAARPVEVAQAIVREILYKTDAVFFTSWFARFDPVFLIGHTAFAYSMELWSLVLLAAGSIQWLRAIRSEPARALGLALFAYVFLLHVVAFQVDGGVRYRAPLDPILLTAMALGSIGLLRGARPRP